MRIAVVFPGQGAQRPGMASTWKGHPAHRTFAEVGAHAGIPDLADLADDPDACASTRIAQPAVFAAGIAAWRALRDAKVEAHAVAGHSLGEVTAAVASGALSVADGAVVVAERGRAFAAACSRRPGGMLAVLGLDRDAVRDALTTVPGVAIANDNAPGQVVIAGPADLTDAAADACRSAGGRVRALPVEGAFHTVAMTPALVSVASVLGRVQILDPAIPVISGTTGDLATTGQAIRRSLEDGVLAPVRWVDVQTRLADTADTLIEAGPGGVLRGLARRTLPDVPALAVDTPDAVDAAVERIRTEVAA